MASAVGREAEFVASLEIRLASSESGGGRENTGNPVSRSRSMRRQQQQQQSGASSRLALPLAPPRTSRSLSPALRRTPASPYYNRDRDEQQCVLHGGGGGGPILLPTRKPTPPQGTVAASSGQDWRQHQPRTPPSSPMEARRVKVLSEASPSPVAETSSCPSTPLLQRATRLEVPSRRVFGAPKDSGYDSNSTRSSIVVPRRASGLSRSPSPSPSRHGSTSHQAGAAMGRTTHSSSLAAPAVSHVSRSPSPGRSPSLKVATLVSKQVLSASTASSSSSSRNVPIRLSDLTPPSARKYGTASMASYDRSDAGGGKMQCPNKSNHPSTPPPSRKIAACPKHPPSPSTHAKKSGRSNNGRAPIQSATVL